MSLHSKSLLFVAGLTLVGCAEYDPPPEATLEQPEGGAFTQGQEIQIDFTEPVAADTLKFTIWPNERNVENEIVEGAAPLVETCGVGTCGDLTIELNDKRDRATLTMDGDLGTPGRPMVISLQPGLADDVGNDTGSVSSWDVQFRTAGQMNSEPIEFDNGVYILLAQVEKPIPAVLTLISDIIVLPDGRFATAGGEGDEINGDPKNTRNPENLIIDETDQGFTAHITGFITLTDDGKRLLETEPVQVRLPVGPLFVEMDGVRLFADIVKNPETGKDQLDGTLSFEELRLRNGDRVSEQGSGSTAMIADLVPPELVPEGTPRVCGNVCGAVVAGICEPPEDFPPAVFCEEME